MRKMIEKLNGFETRNDGEESSSHDDLLRIEGEFLKLSYLQCTFLGKGAFGLGSDDGKQCQRKFAGHEDKFSKS